MTDKGGVVSESSVSAWDDYPIHQTSEYVRHPATSDRNFYDRYYFNLHPSSDEYFAIFGLGVYPNLGVVDGFVAVTSGGVQRIMRASRPLTDRADISVGPMRIEIIEPLRKLRVVVESNEADVALDVIWNASIPAFEEPRQYLRSQGTVVFDTQRFAQTGRWEGDLAVGGSEFDVNPTHCGGSRDRSWGIRPVGEPQPDGIRQDISVMGGMWNYMPIDFGDHTIIYMCHEEANGNRHLQEAVRIWSDPSRPVDWLGRPDWRHDMIQGTRLLSSSIITCPDAADGPIEITATPILTNFISLGTGYGMDADWRHGMWQGDDEVVQAIRYEVDEIRALAQYGVVDSVGRFRYHDPVLGEQIGHGLYEHGFFGAFPPMGLNDRGDLHP